MIALVAVAVPVASALATCGGARNTRPVAEIEVAAGSSPAPSADPLEVMLLSSPGLPVLAATAAVLAARRAAPAGPRRLARARRSRWPRRPSGRSGSRCPAAARTSRRRADVVLRRVLPRDVRRRAAVRPRAPARASAPRCGWTPRSARSAPPRSSRSCSARRSTARPAAAGPARVALAYPMGDVLLVVMVRRRRHAARLAREPGLAAARPPACSRTSSPTSATSPPGSPTSGAPLWVPLVGVASPLLIAAAAWSPVSAAAPGRARRLAHAGHALAARARRRRPARARPLPPDRRRRGLARRPRRSSPCSAGWR